MELVKLDEGIYTGTYIGKEMCGFIPNHTYQFELSHNERVYELNTIKDNTDNKDISLYITYASANSIKRNWELN